MITNTFNRPLGHDHLPAPWCTHPFSLSMVNLHALIHSIELGNTNSAPSKDMYSGSLTTSTDGLKMRKLQTLLDRISRISFPETGLWPETLLTWIRRCGSTSFGPSQPCSSPAKGTLCLIHVHMCMPKEHLECWLFYCGRCGEGNLKEVVDGLQRELGHFPR
ncbi:hypothetical protein IG631_10029 [Alternaria alternata]|nr:hypothetical protein IG631_10029 [Alternaria alternata]